MYTLDNQGPITTFTIEEYITTIKRIGRRGSPEIPSGTKLFLLKYDMGGYFTYSFINRADAEKAIENSKFYRTNTAFYREWNLAETPEKTLHYGK